MSLVAFAVRVSLVRILRGATLAGTNVADSPLDPVAQSEATSKSPLINIYSESESVTCDGDRSILQGNRSIGFTLQMFLPVDETVQLGSTQIETSTRRGGGQAIFDVMYRQFEAALSIERTPSVWRDIFNAFVSGYTSVTSRPYVIQTDKGVRLSAREIEMVCETIDSPAFGEVTHEGWILFLQAMADDAGLRPMLPIIRSALTAEVDLTQEEIDTSLLGLSYYEAESIGIAPLMRGSNAALTGVDVVDDDTGDRTAIS